MNFANQCGLQARQRLTGADVQVRFSVEILAQRNIEKRPRSLTHALVLRISDGAYDSRPAAFHLKSVADRILTSPVTIRHGSIDDRYQRCILVIASRKFAAREERNSQSRQISWADLVVLNIRLFVR